MPTSDAAVDATCFGFFSNLITALGEQFWGNIFVRLVSLNLDLVEHQE
jgi:hypothetical protein